MTEHPRIRPASIDSSGSSDDLHHAGDGGLVTVTHGVHAETLPVGNMTVGEIRRRYADRFDFDPAAQAEIDGRNVDDRTEVRAGQLVLFANHSGEKGLRRPSTAAAGSGEAIVVVERSRS